MRPDEPVLILMLVDGVAHVVDVVLCGKLHRVDCGDVIVVLGIASKHTKFLFRIEKLSIFVFIQLFIRIIDAFSPLCSLAMFVNLFVILSIYLIHLLPCYTRSSSSCCPARNLEKASTKRLIGLCLLHKTLLPSGSGRVALCITNPHGSCVKLQHMSFQLHLVVILQVSNDGHTVLKVFLKLTGFCILLLELQEGRNNLPPGESILEVFRVSRIKPPNQGLDKY